MTTTTRCLLLALACLAYASAAAAEEAAPDESDRRYSVLVLDLVPNNADPAEVRIITDLIAAALAEVEGFQVLTSSDVQQAMGIEAQKQALGCTDESCLAELAGALGAELVVSGSAGRLGELHVISLSFFDSKRARSAGRKAIQVREIEDAPKEVRAAVLELVGRIAPEAAAAERAAAPTRSATVASSGGADDEGPPWLLIGGGTAIGVGLLGAAGATTLAFVFDSVLATPSAEADEKEGAFLLGWTALAGVGVASVVVAAGAVALGMSFLE